MISPKQWNVIRELNSISDTTGVEFVVDKWNDESIPEYFRDKVCIFMRDAEKHYVVGYYEVPPNEEQMEALIAGIGWTVTAMQFARDIRKNNEN